MRATQFLFKSVLLVAGSAALAQTASYEQPGPYPAEVVDVRWTDAARQRELPLRVRLPAAAGARGAILFSHGLGGSVESGRQWGEHWASYGFIVIHLQHPGSDETVWQGAANPARAMRAAAGARQLLDRVNDVKFVLDELARRTSTGDPLASRVDLGRIGVSGHSFGAITTQAIAGQRFGSAGGGISVAHERPRAFIAFSPSARTPSDARNADRGEQFGAITRPFFSVTGTRDTAALALDVAPAQRLVPFEAMPAPDKYLLNLDGADHMVFNGGSRPRGVGSNGDRSSIENDAPYTRLTQATTTAFWLAYLDGDAAARQWLQRAAGYIGVAGSFSIK